MAGPGLAPWSGLTCCGYSRSNVTEQKSEIFVDGDACPVKDEVLKVAARQGNTLSPVIRAAWDGGTLQVMTRNTPAKATDAHISLIGHITADELRHELADTEMANGFANRFLWVLVKRSKFLPEPDVFEAERGLVADLAEALVSARRRGAIPRSPAAKTLWASIGRL